MIWDALSWAALALLPFNWMWQSATQRMRRAVPGSLQEEHAKLTCRKFRWLGAMCWPAYIVVHVDSFIGASLWSVVLYTFFYLLALLWSKHDLRELRRQLEEDEDDWWNKGKRGLKKLKTAVKQAATIKIPVATPVGGMA